MKMHRVTADLSDKLYFFLQEEVLRLRKQGDKEVTMISLIRKLIKDEMDR